MKLASMNELSAIWLKVINIISNIQFSMLHKRKEWKKVHSSCGIQSSILLSALYFIPWLTCSNWIGHHLNFCHKHIGHAALNAHILYSYTNIYHCLQTLDRYSHIQLNKLEQCTVNKLVQGSTQKHKQEHGFSWLRPLRSIQQCYNYCTQWSLCTATRFSFTAAWTKEMLTRKKIMFFKIDSEYVIPYSATVTNKGETDTQSPHCLASR